MAALNSEQKLLANKGKLLFIPIFLAKQMYQFWVQ